MEREAKKKKKNKYVKAEAKQINKNWGFWTS